jgi:tetratricopeptide (TPR) repeat protein
VTEVRKQLDRFPTDIEGLLLLAEIQAQNLKDLDAAETTIQRLCNQAGHSPRNIAFALYSMADWHLEIGKNREGAQACLEKLIALFPNTEFSLGAAQRIAHLGSTEMLSERHSQRTIPFPAGHSPQMTRESAEKTPETDDSTLAVYYVEHLRAHPYDTDAREKLAGIYAEHYCRLDLATAELEQLIQHPNHPSRSVVRWLNLLADYQVKCGANLETVQGTLQRIIDRDPNAAAAGLARNRLSLLKLELKANEKSQGVKLGSYEQNIGLKRGLPNQL